MNTHAGDYAAAFAAALLDPSAPAPGGVTGRGGKPAGARYDVYRNNVTVSLIDALAAIYPAVQRITGPDFFRTMARAHVRACPPASPLLSEYGRDFPGFIAAYPHARGLPWLADTARMERAWLDAYHAADGPALAADTLARVDARRLADIRFVPHPATRIVRSRYPAVSIFAMNRRDGPVEPFTSSDPEDALITRPELDVMVSRLPAAGAAFIAGLMHGAPLGAAAGQAYEEDPSFDLSANLAGMIAAGAFSTIHLGA